MKFGQFSGGIGLFTKIITEMAKIVLLTCNCRGGFLTCNYHVIHHLFFGMVFLREQILSKIVQIFFYMVELCRPYRACVGWGLFFRRGTPLRCFMSPLWGLRWVGFNM